MVKKIILVKPRGLCAGVDRSLKILELVVKKRREPVYCRHEIVHNKKVVEEFKQKGVLFVEDLNEVPNGAVIVFSAHGSSPKLFELAKSKKLIVVDAACPLVVKVHLEAKRFSESGHFVLYVGHKGHIEGEGVKGEVKNGAFHLIESLEEAKLFQLPKGYKKLAVLTQTTLSLDETKETITYLKKKFKDLVLPAGQDICFATQNRQTAVKELALRAEMILVVGSKTSSNSNRLRETGEKAGAEAYLIDGPEDLKKEWFEGKATVGITAGASVPDKLVDQLIQGVQKQYGGQIETLGVIEEKVMFPNLPKEMNQL